MMLRAIARHNWRIWFGLVLGAALLNAFGCSEPQTGEESEEDKVTALVDEVADKAGTAEDFQTVFAEGAVPPEVKRPEYHKLMFFAENVDISGDTADITVRVEDFNNNPQGRVTWKAKRQGDRWVLTEAPLP